MRIDGGDQDCRYLSVRDDVDGSFADRLKLVGVELPVGWTPGALVDVGLVRPSLRVRLPDQLFREWGDYPVLRGGFSPEVDWAADLWWWSAAPSPCWGERGGALGKDWYVHPFDRADDPRGRALRANLLSASDASRDLKVATPRGYEARPVMDLVPYWEAYRVAELRADLGPFPPLRATSEVNEAINGVSTDVRAHRGVVTKKVEATQRNWDDLSRTFDWLSRYRTLRATALVHSIHGDGYTAAVQELADNAGLTEEVLKIEIRDKLLVLWQRWHWRGEKSIPEAAFAHLQEDIAIAVELLEVLTSREVDAFDEWWYPPDPNPRLWARLRDALPYEHWKCQELTWQVGPAYLKDFNGVAPLGLIFDHDSLREAVRRWWRESVPFRRFCVAFARLHDEINTPPDPGDLVGLRLSIPVEYLRLCALDTERFLLSLFGSSGAASGKVPRFKDLVLTAFDELCSRCGVTPPPALRSELGRDLGKPSQLDDLPSTRVLPFRPLSQVTPGDTRGLVKCCLFNLAVLRNYAAHHDCLDEEIAEQGIAMPALESMLSLFAIGLNPIAR